MNRLDSNVPTEELLPELVYAEDINTRERDIIKELETHGEQLIEDIKSKKEALKESELDF